MACCGLILKRLKCKHQEWVAKLLICEGQLPMWLHSRSESSLLNSDLMVLTGGQLLFIRELPGLAAGIRRDVSYLWENPALLATGARRAFMVVDPQEEIEQENRSNLVAGAMASLAIVNGLVLSDMVFEAPSGTVQQSMLALTTQFPYAFDQLSCFMVDCRSHWAQGSDDLAAVTGSTASGGQPLR